MDSALRNAIFKIGEVISVAGREVKVKVDKSKNLSHLIYQGQLIKNVSVGGYVKVSKGFVDIIAKVEGESVCEQKNFEPGEMDGEPKLERILTLKLLGHIENHRYNRGIKEMPLLGNECFLLTQEEFSMVHSFKVNDDEDLTLGTLLNEDRLKVRVGAGHLLSSHIGIFGNTGSGKSYTLAHLYKSLFDKFAGYKNFKDNAQFLLFDFNGEYASDNTITNQKKVYDLKTLDDSGDKLPIKEEDLLNVEIFSILAKASEKTQQPFIKRALNLYRTASSKGNPTEYARGILRNIIKRVLEMADNIKGNLLLDYLEQILPNSSDENGMAISLRSDIFWHSKSVTYYTTNGEEVHYFNSNPEYIESTLIYQSVGSFDFSSNLIDTIIKFMYIQLINDVLQNRANNDHIAPAINKLKSVQRDFDKVFVVTDDEDFWQGNYFVVVNLNEANLEMKKLVPLLLASNLYAEHKRYGRSKYLNIIIDEAHNILSYESLRESESWKDFRLETFEEIIKEGRKFGVFLTIASQRPSDISATIISQLHNYFIHRLINEQDIKMIEKAVSYLDRLSIETLPILPVGACIMSGLIADVPVIIQVSRIPTESEPKSQTLDLISLWKD